MPKNNKKKKYINNIMLKTTKKTNKQVLYTDPLIYTIDNFLTDEDCAHFIKLGEGNIKRALVAGTTKGYESRGRSGGNYWIRHKTDEITSRLGERIAKLIGLPLENAEAFQLIHYGVTQEYRQHYDGWILNKNDVDGWKRAKRNMKYGGQRMWTALAYLNDVPKGGGTKFTRLDITSKAKKRKLLVFANTYEGSTVRHELSEHAGLPVKEGEKWAFNLWFREKSRKVLFFKEDEITKVENIITKNVPYMSQPIIANNKIYIYNDVFDQTDIKNILSQGTFKEGVSRSNFWIKNFKNSSFIQKIAKATNTNPTFYENACVVKYTKTHPCHQDAYDLESDVGKKYTSKLGQRIYTIAGFFDDNIIFNFRNLTKKHTGKPGQLLFYKNTLENTNIRNEKMSKEIQCSEKGGTIFNIYVRMNGKDGSQLKGFNKTFSKKVKVVEPKLLEKVVTKENYTNTLNEVYSMFEKNTISKRGFKSMKFTNKVKWEKVVQTVQSFLSLRDPHFGLLNKENFNTKYNFGELKPVLVNNVLNPEAQTLLAEFYKTAIEEKSFVLGDRQAQRFKSHNETMSRILHYEVLPLIEHVVERKLQPTYTYLSCYVADSDLPAHTDRADCQYTVSFIVEKKPHDFYWPIYVHKTKQPIKGKGRYNFTPPKEECISVDCNEGGLMVFQGEDHIHFREKFGGEYYNILLLHFRSI
ncbi:2OG-Fe(II) oxygenase [bacterium]|nr:2OG-Fe(II) oxygenase [bacterium]